MSVGQIFMVLGAILTLVDLIFGPTTDGGYFTGPLFLVGGYVMHLFSNDPLP